MIEKLFDRLNALYPLSNELTERIRSLARLIEYKAGDFILREGQVCNKACIMLKGLARSYYIIEEKDITSRFMDEGFIITSWLSYYTQLPGNEYIEAIEDSTIACIDHSAIQSLYIEFPEFNSIGRKQTEYAFFLAEQRTQMLRKHTAEEKYRFFLEHHAPILQRVALKHIASYLGMNEETLSRVRSRYNRNNSG